MSPVPDFVTNAGLEKPVFKRDLLIALTRFELSFALYGSVGSSFLVTTFTSDDLNSKATDSIFEIASFELIPTGRRTSRVILACPGVTLWAVPAWICVIVTETHSVLCSGLPHFQTSFNFE